MRFFSIVAAAGLVSATLAQDPSPSAILDALLASGVVSQTLSLNDMSTILDCTGNGKEAFKSLKSAIPEMIDKLLAKANRDKGRVLEYTPIQTVNIGENYVAKVKGGTLSCFVSFFGPGNNAGPGAYASQIVATTRDFIASDLDDPARYNVSMLVESNVVELGGFGLMYVPKKYCLDLEDENDVGISLGTGDSIATVGKRQWARPVAMGTRVASLATIQTLVSLLRDTTTNEAADASELTKSAHVNAKAELIALLDDVDACCPLGICDNTLCLQDVQRIVEQDYGLQYDVVGLASALVEYEWMYRVLQDWRSKLAEVDGFVPEGQYTNIFAPFVFDKSIATSIKNAGGFDSVQANPYFTREALLEKIGIGDSVLDDMERCVAESGASSEGRSAAFNWPGALLRRLNEYNGDPMEQLSQWAVYADGELQEGGYLANLLEQAWGLNFFESNAPYFSQNVAWDSRSELQYGNMTQKAMGKTADWLLVSDFVDSSVLQRLLGAHQMFSDDVYGSTASAAVRVDNPCSEAVTNYELYLLMIGVAIAIFGGVMSAAGSLHYFLHWASGCCGKQEQMKRADSQDEEHQQNEALFGKEHQVSGFGRLCPTYECWIAAFGIVIFVGLYSPLVIQLIIEKSVDNFSTSEENVVARYGTSTDDSFPDTGSLGGTPMLVTLINVETSCEKDARPGLLAALLGVSLFFGVLFNFPFFYGIWNALHRYWNRAWNGQDWIPTGYKCTYHDSELTLLQHSVARRGYRRLDTGECIDGGNDDSGDSSDIGQEGSVTHLGEEGILSSTVDAESSSTDNPKEAIEFTMEESHVAQNVSDLEATRGLKN